MAFLVSPGVQIQEKDYTSVVPGVATTNGAFAGAFQWGPVLSPTVIDSENELVVVYGKPITANAKSFFTAANFLAYANNLLVNRADTTGQLNATAKGVGVKINNQTAYETGVGSAYTAALHGTFAAKYPGSFGNSIRVSMCDQLTWAAWPHNSQFDGAPGPTELHVAVIDADGRWTGVAGAILEKFSYLSKASDAKKADQTNAYWAYVLNNQSQYIWQIGNPVNGVGTELNWGANLSITPLTANTSAAGIALSATQTLGAANAAILPGMFVTGPGIPANTFVYSISGTSLVLNQPATSTTSSATTLTFSQFQSLGVATTVTTGLSVAGATTITIANTFTTVVAGMHVTGTGIAGGTRVVSNTAGVIALSIPVLTGGVASGAALVFSQGGSSATLAGGADDFTLTDGQKINAFAPFGDTQTYDVSLILGGDASPAVAINLIGLAENRKDAVAFISAAKSSDGSIIFGTSITAAQDTVDFRNAVGISSSYAFMDSGYKYMYDRYNDVYRWIPLNGDIAGLVARTEFTNDAWWSPGGFTRGQIKGVVKLAFNPNQTDRDLMYKSNVNPVVTFPANGTVLYGDKTMQAKPSAFDRINVRRLFIVLEKAIATAAKYQLFEFNDQFTQANFRNMVEPFLRDVQGRRGITGFKVVCDSTNNTQQVVDTNNFVGDIFVAPTRSINYINLNFIATRTGDVTFSEGA